VVHTAKARRVASPGLGDDDKDTHQEGAKRFAVNGVLFQLGRSPSVHVFRLEPELSPAHPGAELAREGAADSSDHGSDRQYL
jgi:hypothetical protein